MKKQSNHSHQSKPGKTATSSQKEIKTDYPISEKDEVKAAEKRMRKALKDHL